MEDKAEIAIAVAICTATALLDLKDQADRDTRDTIQNRTPVVWVDVNGFRRLDDQTFREHFRMNRCLFECLLKLVGNHLKRTGRADRIRTAIDLKLMMTLWILATRDTFRSVAVKFAVPSRGTVHSHYALITRVLREMAPLFIQWPDRFERDGIKAHFEQKYGYPGVVGCIDGSHIYVSAPIIQPQQYVNRFKKHSILLQAVCDHKKILRDVFVGVPGSVHDSRMFQRSPLSHQLLHNELLSHDEHILGDGAYTLTDKLMTPYRDTGRLCRRQRRHNYIHASCRSSIERAFALLKGLWQRQKLMQVYNLRYLLDTVMGSCVLHNFILLNGEPYVDPASDIQALEVPVIDPDLDAEVHEQPPPPDLQNAGNNEDPEVAEVDPALAPAKVAGRHKRNFIAYMLHPYND